ncbi:MAG: hypothetical protein N2322_06870, partial [Terrimicrobiaceae bacterium]|nr:hypothetical protein [Terrimicrobiaceae bacterium]
MAYPRIEPSAFGLPARVLGIGNAGVHLADRVAMHAPHGVEVVAVNSDARSLAASVAPRKAVLGQRITRGLGAGGDPEIGADAARESLEEIRFAVEGAPLVIVLAGLGGGTGSGAAPLVASAAREAGAFVLALVTMPFAFEGRRRAAQAAQALEALEKTAQAVLRFDNDQMADLTSPKAGLGETFQASDELLSAAVLSFIEMVAGRGPMPIHFGNLVSAFSGGSSLAVFGRGSSSGGNRAHEAIEQALRSPLLDRGRMLEDCQAIVASISGPPSLSFAETAAIMNELGKHVAAEAGLFMGVSLLDDPSAPLSVTLFGTSGQAAARRSPALPRQRPEPKAEPAARPRPTPPAAELEPALPEDGTAVPKSLQSLQPEPPGRLIADPPPPAPPKKP